VLFILMMLLGYSVVLSASDFVVDKVLSKVKWEAKKVTGKHNGSISFENGSVLVTDNKISGGTFIIDMKTIVDEDLTDTGMNQKLMGHLASDDFFSVAKFPESKMVIKKVTLVAGDEYHFLADLTIKGVTNPVEFNAKFTVNGDKLTSEGVITVNRTLFGIKYGSGTTCRGSIASQGKLRSGCRSNTSNFAYPGRISQYGGYCYRIDHSSSFGV